MWKLPKVLIIHLKRFSYERKGGKIVSYVDFPLTELQLSKCTVNPSQKGITYDLFSVINHYGTLTGGHCELIIYF